MDAKRLLRLTVAAVCLLVLTSPALAQVRLMVTSTPFQARQGGVTETAGDIALIMTSPAPAAIPAGTTLSVSMIPVAAAITNNPILNRYNIQLNGGPIFSRVALSVGPQPNTLTISFIDALPLNPGDTIRIRGIRLNVQASGVVFPDQIRVMLTVFPAGIKFEGPNIVGVLSPRPTLQVTFAQTANLFQCLAQAVQRTIVVTEAVPAVFTSQPQENSLSDTPAATNPTQLEIYLTTVPGGLTVDVPAMVPLVAEGVPRGGFLVYNPTASTGCETVLRCTNAMTRDIRLVYDVTGTPDLGLIESATFNLNFISTGNVRTQSIGCVGAQARLVPLSLTPAPAREGTIGPSRIVPRFIDPYQPPQPRPLVCVTSCTCHLKFPYVTNKDGLDTTLIIANATADPYGTSGQSGTVDLYFYGQDAPNPPRVTLPAVAAGDVFIGGLAKNLAPNFEGYIIAIADFRFCKGTAFITDGELATIAHSYTALLIPDPAQFGGRRPGFPLQGIFSGTASAGVLSATITLNDASGERLVQ